MPTVPFAGRRPRVLGHRGAAGLAPENTLPSFALGVALGADVLEFDVHATLDGVIVVLHDPTLERTTNGHGPVSAHSWARIEALDAGYQFSRDGRDFPFRAQGVRIPTLEAVLLAFPTTPCNIEIKQDEPPIVAAAVETIRRCGAQERVVLAAERDAIMAEIRRVAPDIASSFSAGEVADFVSRLSDNGFDNYHPAGCALQIPPRVGPIELVTAESVATAHRYGLEVHVWTINQRDEMEALLALGVDGIVTDLPGVARLVVGRGAP